jgi:hypothetical protein
MKTFTDLEKVEIRESLILRSTYGSPELAGLPKGSPIKRDTNGTVTKPLTASEIPHSL